MVQWIETLALIFGLVLAGLLIVVPRFGPGSRLLLLMLLPACASAGLSAFGERVPGLDPADGIRLSFTLILLSAVGGLLAVQAFSQRARWLHRTLALGVAGGLVVLLYAVEPPYALGFQSPEGYLALGLVGYAAALFLLIVSVIVLAGLEQTLRGVSETVRWELKFLFLGIGALYAAVVYMSSQTLLFAPAGGLLLKGSISLFHCMFLVSCTLILVAWRRGSGRARISVSHGAIYSSVTLLTVGAYLITSALIARWAGRWGEVGLPLEALIFLLSAVVLTALVLGTGLRHRTRAWIRRNIFSGRYDYRHFWLEATERVRSIDPPPQTAAALADIVHRALGAIDVSVWVRRWDPNRLELLAATGTITNRLDKEVTGVVEPLQSVSAPLTFEEVQALGDWAALGEFMKSARAALLVPLVSSNRIAGVITVGPDRSGRPYDNEAREFLRALSGHAAGEFHKSDLLATLVAAKEDEAFRAFSTFLLHDLKNFASTLSYIAQNAPKHQHNPEFQQDAFQSVYDTAEKMKRLCNSLKSFSGGLAANKRPIDLSQVVRQVADTLNTGLGARLELELAPLPPVMADAEEVGRVLQNLILNAREAIGEEGTITVRAADRGEQVEIAVADNGRGMSREFFEKELFLPFRTTKSGGLGIGLFQSKKIMEAHRGSIRVESAEGEGTTITLLFPKPPAE
ncbi:MAG: PEP-CTERM system histidine kinase PrsK [Acidobacteriota bacterium]|jgi:putative PEP-CTERM system histidine kinase|nr:PEP-CTERM system histidine kinase PrsK [Acidobacteriota bacterium]NLT34266.1 PEP-CTERM system histidine kinase PrsK [Acidobacteriota bacterium]